MSRALLREGDVPAPPTPATSGLLAVDKPAGITSHDVVALVRRALPAPGAGHLGTLDPAATGLLLVAVGAATRCVPVWLGGEKTYEATIRLGVETRTQDLQGEVVAECLPVTDEARLRAASRTLVGDLEQVPPMVSAIKVRGQRLHRLARQGVEVARAPRRVHVAEWTWLEFSGAEARCRIRCSGGTYVRTLAHDLGSRLGCGAALAALRRVRSAPFDLTRSVTADALRAGPAEEIWRRGGIPLAAALAHLPHAILEDAELDVLGHGNPVRRARTTLDGVTGTPGPYGLVMADAAGTPLALGEARPDPVDESVLWLQPRVVLPWAVREGRA